MFSKIFGGKKFDELFPSFMPYIKDKDRQQELVNNQELIDKYKRNKTMIETFLVEVSRYHINKDIITYIDKYIIKLDEDTLQELMILYLDLSISEKNNKSFFDYYDKKYGLVDKTEEEIKEEERIDNLYNSKKCGTETFNNIPLDTLYETLDYPERNYITTLFTNKGGWMVFKSLFEDRYHANFKQLIKLLNSNLIDGSIINEDVVLNLDDKKFRDLIFILLSNKNLEIAKHIKTLINKGRYDLILEMVHQNLIGDEVFIYTMTNEHINEDELINRLESIKVKRPLNN